MLSWKSISRSQPVPHGAVPDTGVMLSLDGLASSGHLRKMGPVGVARLLDELSQNGFVQRGPVYRTRTTTMSTTCRAQR